MAHHSRRQLLQVGMALVGSGPLFGCGVLPPQSAPPPRVPRIGLLAPSPDDNPMFVRGLAEHGYAEGRNIAIEYCYAGETVDQLLAPAAELVGLPVDLIVVIGTPTATMAKQTTTAIPIVITAQPIMRASGLRGGSRGPRGAPLGEWSTGPDDV